MGGFEWEWMEKGESIFRMFVVMNFRNQQPKIRASRFKISVLWGYQWSSPHSLTYPPLMQMLDTLRQRCQMGKKSGGLVVGLISPLITPFMRMFYFGISVLKSLILLGRIYIPNSKNGAISISFCHTEKKQEWVNFFDDFSRGGFDHP